MSAFGGLAWGRRRGGRLTLWEEARVTGALVLRRLRAGAPPATAVPAEVASLDPPDSRIVLRALEQAREECAPAVFDHSLRTHAWAVLFGEARGLACDRELLAVAAILHDIELGKVERRGAACRCFACAGAERALRVLSAEGLPAARAAVVADAIARHLNPAVPLASGIEAHLLHAGAAMDVVGAGARSIARVDRARVLARYPRGDLAAVLVAAMTREASAHPRTRAGLLMRLGLAGMIAHAERVFAARRSGDGAVPPAAGAD